MKNLSTGKLDSHAKVGRFVGYDKRSKGCRVYYPKRHIVGIERDVRFNPNEVLVSEDNVGGEGEWHLPAPDPTVKSGTPDIPESHDNHPNQPEFHKDGAENPPDQPSEQDPAPEARIPDGLIPAQPNTGRGFREH